MFHHRLGVVYANQGKKDEAVSQQKRAITIQPQLSQAHHQLGMLYGQQNLWDKAISAYLIALKQNPELVESSYNLAQASFRDENMPELGCRRIQYQNLKSQIDPINKLRGVFQQSRSLLIGSICDFKFWY
jgi:tetratricopeptide (TPR) repeat protein